MMSSSISSSLSLTPFHSTFHPLPTSSNLNSFRSQCSQPKPTFLLFRIRASSTNSNNDKCEPDVAAVAVKMESIKLILDERVTALRELISAQLVSPPALTLKRQMGSKFAVGLYVAFAFMAIVVRQIMLKRHSHDGHGSVAELVKRGHLRSDRRGISKPLKYEDPFNNPLVKVGKSSSTVEMCGKIYRLAPVALTEEQQSIHQRRRSRVYQWTRPTVYLKEGDPMPPDVDPDTVRWVPANHPFATTDSDIDDELAQNNVSQKDGTPSRVKAEHEALQRKLEDLERGEKMNKVVINPKNNQDLKPNEVQDLSPSTDQQYGHITMKHNPEVGSSEKNMSLD